MTLITQNECMASFCILESQGKYYFDLLELVSLGPLNDKKLFESSIRPFWLLDFHINLLLLHLKIGNQFILLLLIMNRSGAKPIILIGTKSSHTTMRNCDFDFFSTTMGICLLVQSYIPTLIDWYGTSGNLHVCYSLLRQQ